MAHDTNNRYASVSLARRIGAIFYDLLIVIAILLVSTIFWTYAGVTIGHPWYRAYVGFVYLVIFLYFGWCWVHGGQTVGMKVWKIKLVGVRVGRFGWAGAMTRSAVAILSIAAFGSGFWWALLDRDQMTWHDRLSASRLVRV